MTYRETNSREDTQKLYEEYLAETKQKDCEESYNAFYDGAEREGFTISICIPLDQELSKKCGMNIPSTEGVWYELKRPHN